MISGTVATALGHSIVALLLNKQVRVGVMVGMKVSAKCGGIFEGVEFSKYVHAVHCMQLKASPKPRVTSHLLSPEHIGNTHHHKRVVSNAQMWRCRVRPPDL